MNKKGFTLIELMVVIVIIAVTSASSVIVFNNIDDEAKEENVKNLYKQVQRAAILYMELKTGYIEQFSEEKQIYIYYSNLLSDNYVTTNVDSKIDDLNKDNTLVKIFIDEDDNNKSYVSSSIVEEVESNLYMCVADNNGKYERYKDYIPYVSTQEEFYNSSYLMDLYDSINDKKSGTCTSNCKYEKYKKDINSKISSCGSEDRYKNCNCY